MCRIRLNMNLKSSWGEKGAAQPCFVPLHLETIDETGGWKDFETLKAAYLQEPLTKHRWTTLYHNRLSRQISTHGANNFTLSVHCQDSPQVLHVYYKIR